MLVVNPVKDKKKLVAAIAALKRVIEEDTNQQDKEYHELALKAHEDALRKMEDEE